MFDYQIKRIAYATKWNKKHSSKKHLSFDQLKTKQIIEHKKAVRREQSKLYRRLQLQQLAETMSWLIIHGVRFDFSKIVDAK